MEQFIKDVLGCNIINEEYKLPPQFPQYLLSGYSYQKYTIENQECLFVLPYDFFLTSYKKHYSKIAQLTNMHVVLQMRDITPYQRKALIDERIPFVIENMQIYLPFLAISLVEKYYEKTEIEKFAPITQLVFLYLFYHKEKKTATDLAPIINCSTMSVTRAYKALVDCGLFIAESDGVKKYIVPKADDSKLLKDADGFFINPIVKTIYVDRSSDMTGYLISGLYALGMKTMLNASEKDKHYAIYQKELSDTANAVTKSAYVEGMAAAVEKWGYDPKLLTKDKAVDDISLILSLRENKDERIQMEIDRLRRKYQW